MAKLRDPKISIFDILNSANNCLDFTAGMSFEQFEKDLKTLSAVQHQILVIGEAAKRLPNEFREQYSQVPWKQMTGTRDVLIHAYEEADFKIIWDIIKVQLPLVVPVLEEILESLN